MKLLLKENQLRGKSYSYSRGKYNEKITEQKVSFEYTSLCNFAIQFSFLLSKRSGPVPASLGQLSQLQELNLRKNELTGKFLRAEALRNMQAISAEFIPEERVPPTQLLE